MAEHQDDLTTWPDEKLIKVTCACAARRGMASIYPIEPLLAECAARGLTKSVETAGFGYLATVCCQPDCGKKALYRLGRHGYCKTHRPLAVAGRQHFVKTVLERGKTEREALGRDIDRSDLGARRLHMARKSRP